MGSSYVISVVILSLPIAMLCLWYFPIRLYLNSNTYCNFDRLQLGLRTMKLFTPSTHATHHFIILHFKITYTPTLLKHNRTTISSSFPNFLTSSSSFLKLTFTHSCTSLSFLVSSSLRMPYSSSSPSIGLFQVGVI